jgi:hypothetical protein
MSEQDHPFYRPLWRRIAIVAVTALWAAFELYTQSNGLFMALSCGAFAYSVWTFLITYPREPRA